MDIRIPKLSLVALIGPSGAGKSTFARKHFLSSEVISSDDCRGVVSDDENDQSATRDAFDVLHYIAAKRLKRGRLTVIDATNVQQESRKPLVKLAKEYHCLPVAIVLNPPASVCHARNRDRPDRNFGEHVIKQQRSQLRRNLKRLKREGFRHVFVLDNVNDIEAATVQRVPLWNDKTHECGPFDFIGDVHGCCDELESLLGELGYMAAPFEENAVWGGTTFRHPEGRKAVFVGDLIDRGPRVVDVLRIARNMVAAGDAFCVPGNHDVKLLRKLRGKNPTLTHGLAETVAQIDALPEEIRDQFCKELADFIDGLVSHYLLDGGRVVVAHAGLTEDLHGRASGRVREFALYGDTTGETDEAGLPIRRNWAANYRGKAMVVYGHTPVPQAEWLNGTINIDTGCVFGGSLTALRYPEREIVSVDAARAYCQSPRDISQRAGEGISIQQTQDQLLDAADVLGKRFITTRLQRSVTIREENATAALEVMSRFATDPRWLIYLPPTMSPCETSSRPGMLEHPAEAFSYFRGAGVPRVICQEKHMGSRAVVVVCRDHETARVRFGVEDESGAIFTRTGRRFFSDTAIETGILERIRDAMTAAGFWEELETGWACLDCELMPWSAKAMELLRSQYAAVGAASQAALPEVMSALQQTSLRLTDSDCDALIDSYGRRLANAEQFTAAYRPYCWSVEVIDDFKLAPFHLLATEGSVHVDRDHAWHMESLSRLSQHDPELLLTTNTRVVDINDPQSQDEAVEWWEAMTAAGGEGMVIKPLDWVVRGKKGLVQPAVKCRGREYLRIIYGPDYLDERNLSRVRGRSLGRKRSLALREFALGIEALERFVRGEPLRRVHECVFGVLALESEPVDPRL